MITACFRVADVMFKVLDAIAVDGILWIALTQPCCIKCAHILKSELISDPDGTGAFKARAWVIFCLRICCQKTSGARIGSRALISA